MNEVTETVAAPLEDDEQFSLRSFFTPTAYDLGPDYAQFYDCVAQKDFGQFKKGDKIEVIAVDFFAGVLHFYKASDAEGVPFATMKLVCSLEENEEKQV